MARLEIRSPTRSRNAARALIAFNVLSSWTAKGGAAESLDDDIKKQLRSLSSQLSGSIERVVAKDMGAKVIKTISGKGASPDLIYTDTGSLGEVKAKKLDVSLLSEAKTNIFNSSIDVTTAGVSITKGSSRQLLTGVDPKTLEQQGIEFQQDIIDVYIDTFLGDTQKLKKALIRPDSFSYGGDPNTELRLKNLLNTIRTNIYNKARQIVVPIAVNGNQVRNMVFTFDMDEVFSSKNSFLDVSFSKTSTGRSQIFVNVKYPQSVLNNAFKIAGKSFIEEAAPLVSNNIEKNIVAELKKIKADKNNFPAFLEKYTKLIKSLDKKYNNQVVTVDVGYDKGSVVASRSKTGVVSKGASVTSKTKKPTSQFISAVRLTQLAQRRIRLRMRRGEGPARPPKVYERTGTLRESVEVVANYRTNTVNYFYLPHYDSLEKYGYEIGELIEGSIRAVVQEQFSRQFTLVRRSL